MSHCKQVDRDLRELFQIVREGIINQCAAESHDRVDAVIQQGRQTIGAVKQQAEKYVEQEVGAVKQQAEEIFQAEVGEVKQQAEQLHEVKVEEPK